MFYSFYMRLALIFQCAARNCLVNANIFEKRVCMDLENEELTILQLIVSLGSCFNLGTKCGKTFLRS